MVMVVTADITLEFVGKIPYDVARRRQQLRTKEVTSANCNESPRARQMMKIFG